jgi:hypothetical protein
MNDPHVEILVYQLDYASNVSYQNAEPIDVDYGEFAGRLENDQLICDMKLHYPTIENARAAVEGYLHSWEIHVALDFGRGEFQFVYKDAKVIDRNPPAPGEDIKIHVSSAIHVTSSVGSPTLHVTRGKYPQPPILFEISPDVDTLWKRYEMYLDKKEPLCSMAYFCLTVIQTKAGSRANAARLFFIDENVLDKLGELTSIRGDLLTARKINPGSTPSPLSDKENKWIEAAIKLLIRRMGEYGFDRILSTIKLSDLPSLDLT